MSSQQLLRPIHNLKTLALNNLASRVSPYSPGRQDGASSVRTATACFSSRTICARLSLAQHAAVTGLEIP